MSPEPTLNEIVTVGRPGRIIGDLAYDSDPFDEALASKGIELIAPYRKKGQGAGRSSPTEI